MSDIGEILNKMVETDKNYSRWFFNLLEVLGRKGLINQADLDYIRHHDEEQTGENT